MAKDFLVPEGFYFHGQEINQFLHIQVPILLIKDEIFKNISDSAKILYGLLLNRTGLSIKNGWIDENNRTFIFYTIESLMNDLNIGETKAKKLFAELANINNTGVGLIKKVRVLNKPSRIYVLNFVHVYEYLHELDNKKNIETTKEDVDFWGECYHDSPSDANATHRRTQMRLTDGRNDDSPTDANATINYIDYNNNNNNYNYHSINHYEERMKDIPKSTIKENELRKLKALIEYEHLQELSKEKSMYWNSSDMQLVDVMLDYMSDIIACGENIEISGAKYDADYLANKFYKLNSLDIQYVVKCINENTTKITDIRKYYIKCLLYAKQNSTAAIHSQVLHDMSQT